MNRTAFYLIAILCRLFEGVATAFIINSSILLYITYLYLVNSLLSYEFPDKRGEYQGYMVAVVGVGIAIGPIFCSTLLHFIGYASTFYILGIFIFVGTCIVFFMMPSRTNKTNEAFSHLRDTYRES